MSDYPSFRLDGKTALVTGAARGLGRAYALAFAALTSMQVKAPSMSSSASFPGFVNAGQRSKSFFEETVDSPETKSWIGANNTRCITCWASKGIHDL